MNNTFLEFIINLIVLVPVVVLLIFISLRLSKKSLSKIGSGSYVKVLEKINLSKDICLYVIKSGNTGCIIVTSNNNTQVIKKLNEDEINEIIEMKNQHNDFSFLLFRSEEHTSELQSPYVITYAVFCLKKLMVVHKTDFCSTG